MFDVEGLVAECRQAIRKPEPAETVTEIIGRTISDPSAIEAAVGRADRYCALVLYKDADLTVQWNVWPPGIAIGAHDHLMWAVIGIYEGQEDNSLFVLDGEHLRPQRRIEATSGTVLTLDADAIHSVRNPLGRFTASLHVYGGDLDSPRRSIWDPSGTIRHSMPPRDVGERFMEEYNRQQAHEARPWDPARAAALSAEIGATLRGQGSVAP